MEKLNERKFSFICSSLPADTFHVATLAGSERISAPYRFEVMLLSDNPEIDFNAVINNGARLVFHTEEGDVVFHGIVASFEQLDETVGYAFYRAHLVPRFWRLSFIQNNQVFLNKTVAEFLEAVVKDGLLFSGIDYEFRLQGAYEPIEYVCQYGETNLNFISRWCEREGIYYYFEQTERNEKVIFTDTKIAHSDPPCGGNVVYSPPSGLETAHSNEVVRSFQCRRNVLPAKVLLRDYNYRRPSLEMTATGEVDPGGQGTVYFYHEHFRTVEEGNRLAKVRAESILCRGEEYYGESTVPFIQSGYTITLDRHYRSGFNQKYLAVEVAHEGDQTSLLPIGISAGPHETRPRYVNHFTAIRVGVQFRPQVATGKPSVSGSILANIDAAGSGKYAELDKMGRYKVVIPFDLSGRADGKASSWIRMATPYGGSEHGMHFPLHKGTEVLLTFVNGDPDRPIIAATVPNPSTPSPVTSENQTSNIIHTSGGNTIHMEDQEGSQYLLLHSPTSSSSIQIGAQPSDSDTNDNDVNINIDIDTPITINAAPAAKKPTGGKGITLKTKDWISVSAGTYSQSVLGDQNQFIGGVQAAVVVGDRHQTVIGMLTDVSAAARLMATIGPTKSATLGSVYSVATRDVTMVAPNLKEIAEKSEMLAAKMRVIGDVQNNMIAHMHLNCVTLEELGERENKVMGEVRREIGKSTEAVGEVTKVATKVMESAESKTEITATRTEEVGSLRGKYALRTITAETDTKDAEVSIENTTTKQIFGQLFLG